MTRWGLTTSGELSIGRPAGARPGASLGRLLGRALRRRCPRCGQKGIFAGYYRLVDQCPRCGHEFAREQGYWVAAIIINTAATELLFGTLFVAGILITAPDVEWIPLLAIGVVTNVVFPVFFFPFSKTLWVACDLFFNPADGPH
jgi:uncharacterized protein (DUF983 family)